MKQYDVFYIPEGNLLCSYYRKADTEGIICEVVNGAWSFNLTEKDGVYTMKYQAPFDKEPTYRVVSIKTHPMLTERAYWGDTKYDMVWMEKYGQRHGQIRKFMYNLYISFRDTKKRFKKALNAFKNSWNGVENNIAF